MTLRLTKTELLRLVKGTPSSVPVKAARSHSKARKPRPALDGASPPRESPGEAALAAALCLHGPDLTPPVREARFHPSRRWRFDFSWPASRVACEVDGGQFAHGGGRHATDADRDKLNEAAAMGWRILRFSPQQIERDPAGCVALIRRALEAL